MQAKRKASLLFAVATIAPTVASATPIPTAGLPSSSVAVQPLVLPTGAPACGNVMEKYVRRQVCIPAPVQTMLATAIEEVREIGRIVAVFSGFGAPEDRPLTLVEGRRPGS